MDELPATPMASGRAADVYDLGDGSVLRRYRTDHDVGAEARLMRWLWSRGVPVPAVSRAEGRDLVMEHVAGPTMLEDLQRRPWRLALHARTLARLQRRLATIDAPGWLPPDDLLEDGPSVLHLDLHPMNVLLGPQGPVVIDWTNARRGPAGVDAATTHLLMACAEVDGRRDRIGRRVLVSTFDLARGRRLVADHLLAAARRRMADPNVTEHERSELVALVDRRGAD
jgi:Ser/Thr protein kinase RdoA (MazF antagonist)